MTGTMTLRDHFAGLAMQGLMEIFKNEYTRTVSEKEIAEWSYEQADAMIKERNNPEFKNYDD